MKLPSFLSRIISKQPNTIRFFGLILLDSFAVAYAFEQTESDVQILKSRQFSYSKNFEKVLDDVDTIVYEFETALKFQFTTILFILPYAGLKGEGQAVIQPYRGVISEIVHNLELTPMGYIEMIDVLKDDLHQQESTVYMEIGKLKTQIVFFRDGKRWHQQTVNTNPANIVSHLTEYVSKGTDIFVYQIHTGVNIDLIVGTMSDYVVHKYTRDDMSIHLQHFLKKQLISTPDSTPFTTTPPTVSSPSPQHETEEVIEHVVSASDGEDGSSIVIDTQSIKIQEDTLPTVSTPSVPKSPPSSHDTIAGFKIYENQPKKINDGSGLYSPHPSTPMSEPEYIGSVERSAREDQEGTPMLENEMSAIIDEPLSDSLDPPTPSSLARSLGMSLGIILTITLAGIIVLELYLHKVTLKITLPTETYTMQKSLTALPVSKVIEQKDVKVSVDTTGEKEVGERAKGSVIVASFDDKEASFSAGTRLYLHNAVFTLDSDVVLPPATIDISTGSKQASKKAIVASATFIGSEGNIEKGKQFTVEDYPSSLYYALSESAFGGGAKRTVSVVAPGDIKKLKVVVTEKAKQASESARAGTSGDVVTLDDISSVDIDDLTYSANTGEVASAVSAEGTVKAILYTIQKGKLIESIQKSLDVDKGNGYRFLNVDVPYSFKDIKLSEDEQTCDINFQTTIDIFKALDIPSIKNRIHFQLETQIAEMLKKEYHITTIRFVYDPDLPLFRSFIPYRTENIQIEIDPVRPVGSL